MLRSREALSGVSFSLLLLGTCLKLVYFPFKSFKVVLLSFLCDIFGGRPSGVMQLILTDAQSCETLVEKKQNCMVLSMTG